MVALLLPCVWIEQLWDKSLKQDGYWGLAGKGVGWVLEAMVDPGCVELESPRPPEEKMVQHYLGVGPEKEPVQVVGLGAEMLSFVLCVKFLIFKIHHWRIEKKMPGAS